jgi:hypothetical protein
MAEEPPKPSSWLQEPNKNKIANSRKKQEFIFMYQRDLMIVYLL